MFSLERYHFNVGRLNVQSVKHSKSAQKAWISVPSLFLFWFRGLITHFWSSFHNMAALPIYIIKSLMWRLSLRSPNFSWRCKIIWRNQVFGQQISGPIQMDCMWVLVKMRFQENNVCNGTMVLLVLYVCMRDMITQVFFCCSMSLARLHSAKGSLTSNFFMLRDKYLCK